MKGRLSRLGWDGENTVLRSYSDAETQVLVWCPMAEHSPIPALPQPRARFPSATRVCSQASFLFPHGTNWTAISRVSILRRKESIILKSSRILNLCGEIKSGKKETEKKQKRWGHKAEVLDMLLFTLCCSTLYLLLFCFLFCFQIKQETEVTKLLVCLVLFLFTGEKEKSNEEEDIWHTR